MADPESLPAETQTWPQRPRALTPRGVAIVIALLVFAVAMASASVYFRRTRLEKTTAFWGQDTIRALQNGQTMRLIIPPDSPLLPRSPRPQQMAASPAESGEATSAEATAEPAGADAGAVIADISGTPGLGHFRHALLDERHYEWSTEQSVAVDQLDITEPELITVEIGGPPAEIVPTRLQLELSEGWVGPAGGDASVRLTRRVRPAVRNFIVTLQDVRAAPTP